MRPRVHFSGVCAWLVALGLFLAAPAFAQLPTTLKFSDSVAAAPVSGGNVAEMLQSGQQLESQRRWGEALAHYEEAIRQYPNEATFHERFDVARVHYDLDRRYADRSFCETLLPLSTERTLDLYGQVLLKIESHYVEAPQWQKLVDRGTANLEIALSEPTFVKRNIPEGDRARIDAFRSAMWNMIRSRPVYGRADARDVVGMVARLAQDRVKANPAAIVLEYLCGATNTLDPYSTYLTPDQLNEVYSQIEGNFVGLGVELKVEEAVLVIQRVIPGSPAEEAGVRARDRILAIDRHPTQDLTTDQAATLLQGAEGTSVLLSLVASGEMPRQLTVRRRRVEVPSVDQISILDRAYGVAYLKLTCFQKTTARDLDAALWKLNGEGMRSLVIDVRGNPGGLLVSAVEVADRFIERGVIVTTKGRNAQEDVTYAAHEQGKWRMPLVVLIDQDSASAAEIFAGAVRDYQRGKLIGVKSFGKGSVQGIFPLDDFNAGVRLTTAKFYSPNGHPFSRVGVDPDVVVPTARMTAKPINGRLPDPTDNVLDKAVELARGLPPVVHQARKSP